MTSSDTDPRFGQLIDRLLQLTRDKAIKWTKNPNRRTTEPYSVNLTESTVRLRSIDNDQAEPFMLEILDAEGVVVQTVKLGYGTPLYEEYGDKMAELYGLARHDALDIENVIDSVIRDLDAEAKSRGLDSESNPGS